MAGGGDGLGLAEEVEGHVDVVNEEIENATAGLGFVAEPGTPTGGCATATEGGSADVASLIVDPVLE